MNCENLIPQPITRRQILDSSKLKECADDNFKFDENGRKLSKWVENTVGKGEIARNEQFLLFPQCFQKACFPGASKGVIVWEWVKIPAMTDMFLCYNQTRIPVTFVLFPTTFSNLPETIFNFSVIFTLSSANASNFNQTKILSFDREIILYKSTQF